MTDRCGPELISSSFSHKNMLAGVCFASVTPSLAGFLYWCAILQSAAALPLIACCCLLQVDAWALGCLAAELVTGSPPFEADSRSATYQLIMYRQPRLPAYLSQAAISFIAGSLVKVRALRLGVVAQFITEKYPRPEGLTLTDT